MSSKNEMRRIGRLPLYVAMLVAMPLAGLSSASFASSADSSAETACDSTDVECKSASVTSNGYRSHATINSDVSIMDGGFNGSGAGITIATTGQTATATANGDIAIGNGASADSGASGSALFSTAIGNAATANVENGTALGNNATVTAANGVALGADSVADTANSVSIGSATQQRQITYMAAGTAATDGVNVSQLTPVVSSLGGTFNADGSITAPTFSVGGKSYDSASNAVSALDSSVTANTTSIANLTTNIDNGTVGLVQQSAPGADITVGAGKDGAAVDFTGTAGTRTLTGVTAGDLSVTSTEAVNGAQLFTTNQNVDKNTGDISTINNQLDQISSGAAGLVQQNATSQNITVAAATGGSTVDFTGTAGARTVTGVANGDVSATSADAVNGAQLNEVNQQVSALDGRVSTAEGDITNIKSTIADLSSGVAAGIAYDDPTTKSQVTLGGANGTLITNVADGRIAAGSTDAINGGQLSAVQTQLQNQIGSANDRIGNVEAGLGNIGNGFDGDANNQPITNVGNGVADTDAVNVGQLKQAGTQAVQAANAYTDSKFNALNQSLDQFKGQVNDRFNRQDTRIDRIGAMSAANTQMAINAGGVNGNGNGRVAVGVGVQNSRAALAVGYANTVSDRARMSVGAAFSGSESSFGAGAGFDL